MTMRPRSLKENLRNRSLAAGALALLGALLGPGCSAQPAAKQAPGEARHEATSGADATAAPYPQVSSSGGDLATEEQALAEAEKQLDLAIAFKGSQGEPLDTSADRCEIVCKSLASMVRSAKQVCLLAPERCDAANERVKGASERAKGACPACSTAT